MKLLNFLSTLDAKKLDPMKTSLWFFSIPLYVSGGVCLFTSLGVYITHFVCWTIPTLMTFRILIVGIILLTLGVYITTKFPEN